MQFFQILDHPSTHLQLQTQFENHHLMHIKTFSLYLGCYLYFQTGMGNIAGMGKIPRKVAENGNNQTCQLTDEEQEVRKVHIILMRNLINRFAEKGNRDPFMDNWRKSELQEVTLDTLDTIQQQLGIREEDEDKS